uniref:C-type lectin domain-containing protein n=1 Tax=Astyanax mexicanus TaxID=7994 RepID=A0A8B9LWW0_ASTMX
LYDVNTFVSLSSVVANPTPQCDTANGWEQYGSNCYKLNSQLRKSWIAARTDCVMEGGDLVSIQSADEQQYVISRLDHSPLDMWIDYLWSDGSALSHTNWGPGEPNDHAGRENCVELVTTQNGSSYWNDIFCDAHQDWVSSLWHHLETERFHCVSSLYIFNVFWLKNSNMYLI